MRKYYIILFLVLYTSTVFSQKVQVETVIEELGSGYNNAYRVHIPHAKMKVVKKKWNSFLKQNKAKVKESKGQIRGENVVIAAVGPDSLQLFSKIRENEDGVLLSVAVQQRGVFMSPLTTPTDNAKMESILLEMANELSRSGIAMKTKAATGVLKDKLKEQKKLNRSNKSLARDIEKLKKNIEANENHIKRNTARLESLKKEIEAQQGTIDSIQSKIKEL